MQYGETVHKSLQYLQTSDGILYAFFAIVLYFADKALRVFNLKLLLAKGNLVVAYPKLLHITFVSAFFGFFFPGGSGPDIARIMQLKKHSQGMAKPMSATLWLNIATVQAAALLSLVGAVSVIALDLPINTKLMQAVAIYSTTVFVVVLLVLNSGIQRILRHYFENKLLKKWPFCHRLKD